MGTVTKVCEKREITGVQLGSASFGAMPWGRFLSLPSTSGLTGVLTGITSFDQRGSAVEKQVTSVIVGAIFRWQGQRFSHSASLRFFYPNYSLQLFDLATEIWPSPCSHLGGRSVNPS